MATFAPMPICQDRDRNDRENRAREQPAESVPQVPPQIVGDTETLHVAAFLLDRLHPAQTGERRAARFVRSHAPADVLLDVQLQVRPQLRVELALEAVATEQVHQANGEISQAAHDDSSSNPAGHPARPEIHASPTSRNASSIATATRFQLRASSSAFRRPAGVNA